MVERLGSHCAASTSAGAHCSLPCLRRRREGLAPRANTAPSCSLVLCRHAVEARRTAPARRSSVRPCGARTDNAGSRPLDEAESGVHAAAPLAAEPAASAAIGAGMDVPAFLAAGLALALAGALAAAAPAGAAESGVAYEPGAGGGLLKSLAGAAYLALVAVFVLRLLSKRANSSLTQVRLSLAPSSADSRARVPAAVPASRTVTPGARSWHGANSSAERAAPRRQRWASLRERGEPEEAAKPAQPTRATPLAALWCASCGRLYCVQNMQRGSGPRRQLWQAPAEAVGCLSIVKRLLLLQLSFAAATPAVLLTGWVYSGMSLPIEALTGP